MEVIKVKAAFGGFEIRPVLPDAEAGNIRVLIGSGKRFASRALQGKDTARIWPRTGGSSRLTKSKTSVRRNDRINDGPAFAERCWVGAL
jgi:hypothetical protein